MKGGGTPILARKAGSMRVDRAPFPAAGLAILLLVHALGLAGCGQPEFRSRWLDRDVAIDGNPRDWNGAVYSLDGEMTVVGFLNDSTDLYVCFASSDPNVSRQVLGRGMTVWLDPKGGRDLSFGIHFPLGATNAGAPPPRNAGDPDREALARAFPDSSVEVEIIERGARQTRFRLSQVPGIEVRIGLRDGVLTYEARIPLAGDDRHPYAINVDRSRLIGLGLETPKFKHPGSGPNAERGMPRDRFGAPSRNPSDDSSEGPSDDLSDDPSGHPSNEPSDDPSGDPSDGSRRGRLGAGRPGGVRGAGGGPGSVGPVTYWLRVRLDADASASRAASASH